MYTLKVCLIFQPADYLSNFDIVHGMVRSDILIIFFWTPFFFLSGIVYSGKVSAILCMFDLACVMLLKFV